MQARGTYRCAAGRGYPHGHGARCGGQRLARGAAHRHGLAVVAHDGPDGAGEVSWRNISGPVTIADYAGQTARIGLEAYIAYLALISISLGVLNLLPIPMLDGGHLLYYLVEIVKGSPFPSRIDIGQRVASACSQD